MVNKREKAKKTAFEKKIYLFFWAAACLLVLATAAQQLHVSPYFPDCSILIGAPKSNTSQPDVTEGGAVYLCPWSQANCTLIDFDKQGERVWFRWRLVESRLCYLGNKLYHVTSPKDGGSTLPLHPPTTHLDVIISLHFNILFFFTTRVRQFRAHGTCKLMCVTKSHKSGGGSISR